MNSLPVAREIIKVSYASKNSRTVKGYQFKISTGSKKDIEPFKKKNQVAVIQKTTIGKFIKKWDSISEASKFYGVRSENIVRVCKGVYSNSSKFLWEYA